MFLINLLHSNELQSNYCTFIARFKTIYYELLVFSIKELCIKNKFPLETEGTYFI
nr:MAG TPA: hypothetical protein [Caudoviricetes sp.]